MKRSIEWWGVILLLPIWILGGTFFILMGAGKINIHPFLGVICGIFFSIGLLLWVISLTNLIMDGGAYNDFADMFLMIDGNDKEQLRALLSDIEKHRYFLPSHKRRNEERIKIIKSILSKS